MRLGKADKAIEYYEQSLVIFKEIGTPHNAEQAEQDLKELKNQAE